MTFCQTDKDPFITDLETIPQRSIDAKKVNPKFWNILDIFQRDNELRSIDLTDLTI